MPVVRKIMLQLMHISLSAASARSAGRDAGRRHPRCHALPLPPRPFFGSVTPLNPYFRPPPPPEAAAATDQLSTDPKAAPKECKRTASPLFDDMYEALAQWNAKYRTTVVPRSAQDAGELGEWTAAVRRAHRRRELPAWAVARLNELDIVWKVDVLTAKWHANFHTALEYKQAHGGEDCDLNAALPADYSNEARADWVEASRWVARQRVLFEDEKLTAYRVWALKTLLGLKMSRKYAPRRKNMHAYLKKADAEFWRKYPSENMPKWLKER